MDATPPVTLPERRSIVNQFGPLYTYTETYVRQDGSTDLVLKNTASFVHVAVIKASTDMNAKKKNSSTKYAMPQVY